jgi:hypothetical protein
MKLIILTILTVSMWVLHVEDSSGTYFHKISDQRLDTSGVLLDWMGQPYKRYNQNSLKAEIYANQSGAWIEIDTTLAIDARYHNGNGSKGSIEAGFIDYYQKFIKSPRHGGDPNEAKLSFVVNGLGQIKAIHVLENVRNACSDDWIIHLKPSYIIIPLNINNGSCCSEYIVSLSDICYCSCEIEKTGGGRKKGKN